MSRRRFNARDLVARARHYSGNARLALHRMPRGHWMRIDQARSVRRQRVDRFGKCDQGFPAMAYSIGGV